MKILILGSGAREYSIALALKDHELFFYPGNDAFVVLGTQIKAKDDNELLKLALKLEIKLCIIGSEDFLVRGLANSFRSANIAVFGPDKKAAMLEGSKAFMKDFLKRHDIKTASYISSSSKEELFDFLSSKKEQKIVVKADGLCAGKGVIIAQNQEEAKEAISDMLSGLSFGEAGKKIVLEEYLDGFELSVFAVYDDKDYLILPACKDHKRLLCGDLGPNTGGMGTYAPAPQASKKLMDKIKKDIVEKTIKGLKADGLSYKGVLFIGIMVVDETPFVLEYNVRFGDPETQVLMPLIKDAFGLFYHCAHSSLASYDLKILDKSCVCVVAASKDYPYKSSKKEIISYKNKPLFISKIKAIKGENKHLSLAGVCVKDELLYASGGRVFSCVGEGVNLKEAKKQAYSLMDELDFTAKQYRIDIADGF